MTHLCAHFCTSGDGWWNFEPKRWLNIRSLDSTTRKLRSLYKQNSKWFEVPEFAQKIFKCFLSDNHYHVY
jgi:hypothetical protein